MSKLTTKKRNALPTKDFALPSERKYPLDTSNRAKNALARAAQNATPAQKSKIKSAVKKKFPGIKQAPKGK